MSNVIDISFTKSDFHFAVDKLNVLADSNELVSRFFIVVKDEFGIIVRITRLHEYLHIYKNKDIRPIRANSQKAAHAVVRMLNFLFTDDIIDTPPNGIFDITLEHMQQFFDWYAHTRSEKTKDYVGEQTIQQTIYSCTAFIDNICKRHSKEMKNIKSNDLWVKSEEIEGKRHRNASPKRKIVKKPVFKVTTFSQSTSPKNRDIPDYVLEIMFEMAERHMPHLLMPMALQAYAGLRPSEACSLQQESKGGIRIEQCAGSVTRIILNLKAVRLLRSDSKPTGGIKKPREQLVYPKFHNVFMGFYQKHLQLLESYGFEKEYAPLVVNTQGIAMTYSTYSEAFKTLMNKYVRPALLAHPNPRCQQYGQILESHPLAPHALRHWFSVALVLSGENAVTLQSYRGDKDISSAQNYIANKSAFVARYHEVAEQYTNSIIRKGVSYVEN